MTLPTTSIVSEKAARDLLGLFQAKPEDHLLPVGYTDTHRDLQLTMRRCSRRYRGVRSASGGLVISARLPVPKYGGRAIEIRRSLSPGWDLEKVHRAIARCHVEAMRALGRQRLAENLYLRIEQEKQAGHKDLIEKACSQHEHLTGRTAIYADMNHADVENWHSWLDHLLRENANTNGLAMGASKVTNA